MLSSAIHVLSEFESDSVRDYVYKQLRTDNVLSQMNTMLDGFKVTYAKIIEENLLNVIRSLHFADSFLVVDDINNSYMTIHATTVGFSVSSIVLTCVVILGIILTVISKLDYYNDVCTDIVNMFDRALKNYNELSQ